MLIYASVIIKVKNYACAQLNHKCNDIFSKAKKINICKLPLRSAWIRPCLDINYQQYIKMAL